MPRDWIGNEKPFPHVKDTKRYPEIFGGVFKVVLIKRSSEWVI